MRTSRWMLWMILAIVPVLWNGCGEQESTQEETQVIPDGKMDNFFSLSAQEYMVEGVSTVEIEASYADADEASRLDRVHELIYYKQIAINWFLLQYLMGPEDEHENKFQSLTKNGSYEDLEITPDETNPLLYSFKFRQEVGGQLDLIDELDTTLDDSGKHHFKLPVGKVSNSDMAKLDLNSEWYRRSPWSTFDPAKVDASKMEDLDLAIWAESRSSDAWIDYPALMADGELTISVHFGWDYHKEYHLLHSKDVYQWLVSQGFESPVDSYDAYTRTSGPLTRTIVADGKNVAVKVWIYWGKPGTDTDPDTAAGGRMLEQDMRDAFKTRDVIMYSGHSGPFYGFALANWRKTDEGDLDDSEVETLDMPSDKYQVVLAEGCDTYAMGQSFWLNPNKPNRTNLDVVTTTNFSNASTAGVVKNFLSSMFSTDSSHQHTPWTYGELLQKLDGNSYWFHSMYGVHGIDDNPKLHPYARTENFCTKCSVDSDCGGIGNKCIRLNGEEKVCSAECLDTMACPDGYECRAVSTGSWVTSKQCVPLDLTCTVTPEPEDAPVVMINEVLADPPMETGDANGDGYRSATQDEFVEFVSLSAQPIDLGGWSVADSFGSRFVFEDGTMLLPGRALVLFGGGDETVVKGAFAEVAADILTAHGLGLTNGGDSVTLIRPDGTVSDSVLWGSEGGQDRSLVRETEGDIESAMVLHPGDAPFSPGTLVDGSNF